MGIYRYINGIKEEFISIENKESNTIEDSSFDPDLHVDAGMIDDLVIKHEKCNIIILLTDLPGNFTGSKTWIKINEGKLLLGLLTNNLCNKGGMIFENEISACVVPRGLRSYDKQLMNSSLEEVFALRYIDINSENVSNMLKEHRQLFQPANTK